MNNIVKKLTILGVCSCFLFLNDNHVFAEEITETPIEELTEKSVESSTEILTEESIEESTQLLNENTSEEPTDTTFKEKLVEQFKLSELFPDPSFARLITEQLQQLGIPINNSDAYVTKEDLLQINIIDEKFNNNYSNLSSIEGIQFLKNLTAFEVSRSTISDISHITNLQKLKRLWISYSNITDISPLITFFEMNDTTNKTIVLNSNNISDFSPLSQIYDSAKNNEISYFKLDDQKVAINVPHPLKEVPFSFELSGILLHDGSKISYGGLETNTANGYFEDGKFTITKLDSYQNTIAPQIKRSLGKINYSIDFKINIKNQILPVELIKEHTILGNQTFDYKVPFQNIKSPYVYRVDKSGLDIKTPGNYTLKYEIAKNYYSFSTVPEEDYIPFDVIVTVLPVKAESISLSTSDLVDLKIKEEKIIKATILPATSTDKEILWKSSDSKVATVDINGKITAVNEGTAKIIATVKETDISKEIVVKVLPIKAEQLYLSHSGYLTLNKGTEEKVTATVYPENATEKEIIWTSSNPKIATVDSKGNIKALKRGDTVITAAVKDSNLSESIEVNVYITDINVGYRTHIQKRGWESYFSMDGQVSGTEGQALRLEGIQISLPYVNGSESGVTYQTHVQTYGWQDWVSNGETSGTEGQAKRLEAIKLKLTGVLEKNYDIYYRVHAQKFGWLDWAKNGESAGTAGFGYRLEGIQIMVLPKGDPAPGSTNNSFKEYIEPMKVNYSTHVQSYGWQKIVSDGKMSGTEGKAKRLEGIKINITKPEVSGDITYRTHVQSYGWQDWKSNNQVSGTSGEAKRLEAIDIKLTGELAKKYDIYYRVHSQKYGWLGWAKNGEHAGTSGLAYRLEGIEIKIVEKGASAPGDTKNAYVKEK
ncbi:Ig-like domain-containing protein [Jeotgalibaca sp. MA1X17-3]|uniref:Ig-like domain-containing protein n=1 Tax=Jeotgalibaca sp. MA1X17-3 TaxID=2908211 RepID=UPI001F21B2D8|nr:Ig-like domain-containing protein [Jeotgalibaca sp. MA1X17-3]UJF15274.1 Ig-like domain-containing protein [Jeotgalibaca sp. MA1X17-3]